MKHTHTHTYTHKQYKHSSGEGSREELCKTRPATPPHHSHENWCSSFRHIDEKPEWTERGHHFLDASQRTRTPSHRERRTERRTDRRTEGQTEAFLLPCSRVSQHRQTGDKYSSHIVPKILRPRVGWEVTRFLSCLRVPHFASATRGRPPFFSFFEASFPFIFTIYSPFLSLPLDITHFFFLLMEGQGKGWSMYIFLCVVCYFS